MALARFGQGGSAGQIDGYRLQPPAKLASAAADCRMNTPGLRPMPVFSRAIGQKQRIIARFRINNSAM
jgi:hypothetical protein